MNKKIIIKIYDTIETINVDSEAEYSLSSTRSQKKKETKTNKASAPLNQ